MMYMIDLSIIIVLFGIGGHVALDRNRGPGYNSLLLRLIPGDLLNACPHRQFHTLPSLLDSWAALSNSDPNKCVPNREASCTILMMVFGMTQLGQEPATYSMIGGHAKLLIPTLHRAKIIWIAIWIAIQNMYPFTRNI